MSIGMGIVLSEWGLGFIYLCRGVEIEVQDRSAKEAVSVLHICHVAAMILRVAGSVGGFVAGLALPLAHWRSALICSAMSLLSGTS